MLRPVSLDNGTESQDLDCLSSANSFERLNQ